MTILKQQVPLLAALVFFGSAAGRAPQKNTLLRSTSQVAQTTAKHTYGALCSVARGTDHLFYPALCALAGKQVYQSTLQSYLGEIPAGISHAANLLPVGGSITGKVFTYTVAGGLLCATVNYASNLEPVNDFIQTNMPHISALLQHIKTELSYGAPTSRTEAKAKKK